MDLPEALRQLAAVLETKELPAAQPLDRPRYFVRATAPEGCRGRTWDAMVRGLTREGKCFRPGREIMIRCDDAFAWIEAHPVARAEPVERDDDAPIDIRSFRRGAR